MIKYSFKLLVGTPSMVENKLNNLIKVHKDVIPIQMNTFVTRTGIANVNMLVKIIKN